MDVFHACAEVRVVSQQRYGVVMHLKHGRVSWSGLDSGLARIGVKVGVMKMGMLYFDVVKALECKQSDPKSAGGCGAP